MDVLDIAQGLINKLLADAQAHEAEAQKALLRAEGVKLLYDALLEAHSVAKQGTQAETVSSSS